MKKVVCVNDKNLPQGAVVIKDEEYTVIDEFLNNWGQRVYVLAETTNSGTTDKGFVWKGYDATRFKVTKTVSDSLAELEGNFMCN